MRKKIIYALLFLLLIISFTSADTISPGYRGISINNYIANINDYPNYIFVSGGGIGTGMCPLKIINSDGKIDSYYKFCNVFVYAIPKDNINISKIDEMNLEEGLELEEIKSYLYSIGGKEVLNNLGTYKQIPITSPLEEENNYFNVSLSQVKIEPDKTENPKNNLIYFYILIPIIALIIIMLIIVRKRK